MTDTIGTHPLLPRLVIAGSHSGAGKTTLSLALMAALSRRSHTVRPFKTGPDYIDPTWHRAAAGTGSHNLDAWLLDEAALLRLFAKHAAYGAQGVNIIEGVMGLYDGIGSGVQSGTAHVAALLRAPVILVVNAQGAALSAAALVKGYADFAPRLPCGRVIRPAIAGAIFNQVSGERHYALLREALREHCAVPAMGYLPKGAFPSLPERRLGLVPAEEQAHAGFFAKLAACAEKTLDLGAILAAARAAPPLPLPPDETPAPTAGALPRPVRIGVARDEAFSFYYQDNFTFLQERGAELIFFSPLRDAALPAGLHGLYLSGGFPDLFADALEANSALRKHIYDALEGGLPAYAECGAMLYLCDSLLPRGNGETAPRPRKMCGFFPCGASMEQRLQQPFGYVFVTLTRDCAAGPAGTRVPAHEFHYSRVDMDGQTPCVRVEKLDGRTFTGGLCRKNVFAMHPHLHFYGAPFVAASFLAACRGYAAQTDTHP